MSMVTIRSPAFCMAVLLIFATWFSMTTSHADQVRSPVPERKQAAPPSEMDEVAEALHSMGKLHRVRESIVLNMRDEDLFEPKQINTLSDIGRARLAKIGAVLRAHSNNQVYIEEYVPSDGPPIKTTWLALARADVIRNELINQAISVDRLTVDLGANVTKQNALPGEGLANHRFTLRIVPNPMLRPADPSFE